MIGLLCFVLAVMASPFKSKLRLEAENAVLRHQLIVLRRRVHGRVRLTNHYRWFFIRLYRWFPSILKVLTVIRPETLVRWHRAGFRCYWRWKSRPRSSLAGPIEQRSLSGIGSRSRAAPGPGVHRRSTADTTDRLLPKPADVRPGGRGERLRCAPDPFWPSPRRGG